MLRLVKRKNDKMLLHIIQEEYIKSMGIDFAILNKKEKNQVILINESDERL